jgi:6-pyruvoyltetrahydropterin/6-carboxytetrahydropterin synthase|tara:strand:+ start:410 stop:778 length:369 start_codon:yes stop_codon:yes gene_type:complete
MRYEISKEFAWSASHVLNGLPEGHQCGRLHGHNYIARVTLGADDIDRRGFVYDYGDMKPLKELIDDLLDHRHLNDIGEIKQYGNPTAENLSRWLYAKAESFGMPVVAVSISETPKTWATYRR